jgi:7-keto-8-aminopelargonate synthetase-like enzyme
MNALAEPLRAVDPTHVRFHNRTLTYFGGCDYFRLSSHPSVVRALEAGLKRYGLNVAASRKTTGNHVLYGRLEERLADFFGAADAVLISNGYATNLVVAQALAGGFSHVLMDERAHGSLVDAAVFFDCPLIRFKHRDAEAVGRVVERIGRQSRPVLLTDGLYSHDGTLAPVREYLDRLPGDSVLVLDDAHGAGVLGRRGRGTAEALGVKSPRMIQTVSLSKAFGVYGGVVVGSRAVCDRVRAGSRLFGGNTPPPLPLASAALAAVALLKRNATRRRRLDLNVAMVKEALRARGVGVPDMRTPIVSVTPGRAAAVRRLSGRLLDRGVYPSYIRYPGGPAEGSFRFAISSEHSQAQLESLVGALAG